MIKLGLCTPARNEEVNIRILYERLAEFKEFLVTWLIIENDSNDRTLEVAQTFSNTPNLSIYVISRSFGDDYNVGVKYSAITSFGLAWLYEKETDDAYIGICDADCVPSETYYKDLVDAFARDPKLALTSGYGIMDGEFDGEGVGHVRGNCRLWRQGYFASYHFPIEPSPDSISKFEAMLDGWDVYPTLTYYRCRSLGGAQKDFSFYGYSASYRGVSSIFAIAKSAALFLKAPRLGATYLSGFMRNKILDREFIRDAKLRHFIWMSSLKAIFQNVKSNDRDEILAGVEKAKDSQYL
jgi:glycosyltransferase involved in cell wall biosynthesis